MGQLKPPVSLLWEMYQFSPLTGRFYAKCDSRRKKAGDLIRGNHVGNEGRSIGTHQLSINGSHRYPYAVCVWAWIHGEWPEHYTVDKKGRIVLAQGAIQDNFFPHHRIHVDHINGNPFDHRPCNLQLLLGIDNIRKSKGRQYSEAERSAIHRAKLAAEGFRLEIIQNDAKVIQDDYFYWFPPV